MYAYTVASSRLALRDRRGSTGGGIRISSISEVFKNTLGLLSVLHLLDADHVHEVHEDCRKEERLVDAVIFISQSNLQRVLIFRFKFHQ